ncbi:MAG: prohibitin family protein [Clostridia bacterium]|nr:prohibitin family protein [Clostridia bacterium]
MEQNFTMNNPQPQKPKKAKSGAPKKFVAVLSIVIAVVILLIIFAATCIRSVPTGYTGILTTFGKVEDSNLEAGVHVIAPWQNIVLMDNRVQKQSMDTQAFSSDIQQVDVSLAVTYTINKTAAANLYQKVGLNYYNSIIYPQLMENVKTVFAYYTAEGLIETRDELATKVTEMMRADVSSYGIDIANVAIENIDFSDSFTDAIEAKQVATQELQRAETQQKQAILEAEAAAERERIAAQAKADVAKIEADAEAYAITAKAAAEAEANLKVAESLTGELIEYTQAQLWDGKLPDTYVGSSDSLPVLNIGAQETAETVTE